MVALKITVEVVYATADTQRIIEVEIEENATYYDAIKLSGIVDAFPAINLNTCMIGVFSQLVKSGDRIKAGDRIEIYRPLITDPKQARRKRAIANPLAKKN